MREIGMSNAEQWWNKIVGISGGELNLTEVILWATNVPRAATRIIYCCYLFAFCVWGACSSCSYCIWEGLRSLSVPPKGPNRRENGWLDHFYKLPIMEICPQCIYNPVMNFIPLHPPFWPIFSKWRGEC